MSEANPLVLKLAQSGMLADEDFETLENLCHKPFRIAAGDGLIEAGERVTGVPLVMSGFAIRYALTPEGRRQILGLLLPGDFCDIQGAILGRSDHYTEALTDAEIVWFDRETVDDLTLARSRIARALWWAALVDECILRSWLTNMGQRPADRRLAHFCCELLLRLQVVRRADEGACEMPFTQERLAEVLGISPVHTNRTLQDLRGRKLMQIEGKRLLVADIRKLRAFCGFDPTYLHLKGRETPYASGPKNQE